MLLGFGYAGTASAELALVTTIGVGSDHTAVLHLSLKNEGKGPVRILTGMRVGGTDYPVEEFHFAVTLKDGAEAKVFCQSCEPAGVAGSMGAHSVILAAKESFEYDVPMKDLLYEDGAQSLCEVPKEGARMTVTLVGREWMAASNKTAAAEDVFCLGTVSAIVPLTCGAV